MMHFQLQLQRIFFVGDSETFQMLRSFWQLMATDGQPSIIQIQTRQKEPRDWNGYETKYKSFSRELICGEFTLEVVFVRNDNLRDLGKDFYHQNWMEPYVQNPANTLFVANTGMHTPDQETYQSDLDQFIETVHSLNRPHDMIIFRSSVPGHANCKRHKQPLASASEIPPDSLYQWGSIAGYNQYTKRKLSNLGSSWVFLDVYPITILRPDGHKSPDRDCLHYHLPGPPDWWNHLMFSNLFDLARHKM